MRVRSQNSCPILWLPRHHESTRRHEGRLSTCDRIYKQCSIQRIFLQVQHAVLFGILRGTMAADGHECRQSTSLRSPHACRARRTPSSQHRLSCARRQDAEWKCTVFGRPAGCTACMDCPQRRRAPVVPAVSRQERTGHLPPVRHGVCEMACFEVVSTGTGVGL